MAELKPEIQMTGAGGQPPHQGKTAIGTVFLPSKDDIIHAIKQMKVKELVELVELLRYEITERR